MTSIQIIDGRTYVEETVLVCRRTNSVEFTAWSSAWSSFWLWTV